MKTISFKVDRPFEERVRAAARRSGASLSEFVRGALEEHLASGESGSPSCLDLARDLAGCVEAAPDLSSHPRHLREYGR